MAVVWRDGRYAPRAVAEFLSDAWIAELDGAARGAPTLASLGDSAPLVVEQQVRVANGAVAYHFVFDASGARVRRGPASDPDVVLVTDVDSAWGLACGALAAADAVAAGRVRLRGRMDRLRAAGPALQGVQDVFARVRASTTAPGDAGRVVGPDAASTIGGALGPADGRRAR